MPKVVSRKGHASGKESLCIAVAQAKKHLFPNQPLRLAAFFTIVMRFGVSLHRDAGASGYPASWPRRLSGNWSPS
jgi:hypothetical protein